MEQKRTANASTVLEENLKKALTEMLVLRLLSEREYYIGELGDTLKERSGGALCIVFPYAAIYRMEEYGYIYESGKRIGPDGRRRQYIAITDEGRVYVNRLIKAYAVVSKGVQEVLEKGGLENG